VSEFSASRRGTHTEETRCGVRDATYCNPTTIYHVYGTRTRRLGDSDRTAGLAHITQSCFMSHHAKSPTHLRARVSVGELRNMLACEPTMAYSASRSAPVDELHKVIDELDRCTRDGRRLALLAPVLKSSSICLEFFV
jgi:hypothetical protein